jgi:carboxyvinyl-carboxyphosphonate phosphorylmutase
VNWSARRAAFRAVLAAPHCVHPASVYDPISARIAEDIGFELGMFAGSTGSLTVLGAPDLIVLTLSEFAAQALRINRAGNLPLLVDADHGYGGVLNAKRTVEELETAGVAGLTIEDTVLPQPFGEAQVRLIPIAEGVAKMRAALAGRGDPSLVVAGRTSAVAVSGVEDAIIRTCAYQDAGVDAIFLAGVSRRDQLDAIAEKITVPIILGGTSAELLDRDYLAARGVRVCLQGHQPIMAAFHAVQNTLQALRDGTPPAELAGLPSKEMMQRVTREKDYRAWLSAG